MAYQYTLLRYVPDLVKGEFVNLAVVLLDEQGRYREARTAGEKEWRRLKWLHPAADLTMLRELLGQFAEPAECLTVEQNFSTSAGDEVRLIARTNGDDRLRVDALHERLDNPFGFDE